MNLGGCPDKCLYIQLLIETLRINSAHCTSKNVKMCDKLKEITERLYTNGEDLMVLFCFGHGLAHLFS